MKKLANGKMNKAGKEGWDRKTLDKDNIIVLSDVGHMTKLAPPECLVKQLQNYAEAAGNPVRDDEEELGMFVRNCQTEAGICVRQQIKIGRKDYVCYTALPLSIFVGGDDMPADYFQIINAINLQLDYGNFEICAQSAEVRCRTYYMPNGDGNAVELYQLLDYPLGIIDRYREYLLPEK